RQGFTKRCGLGLAVRIPPCMPQRFRSKNTSPTPRRKPKKWRSCNWLPNWREMWNWRKSALLGKGVRTQIIINHLKIRTMKKVMLLVCTTFMLAVAPSAKAQWVVVDPSNLASGIINSANEIVQTSSTVSNVVKNFNEVKKVYEQGKEYYDKLKAVNNLVKDARKVQQTVLLVGDVSEMYVQNFGKMMNDPNFTPQELVAIGNGYSSLLNESTALLKELKQIVSASGLSLNDKERME